MTSKLMNTQEKPSQTMRNVIVDDLEALLSALPSHIQEPLRAREDLKDLLEVVLDLGRPPEARFPNSDLYLTTREVTDDDLQYVTQHIGSFGDDNRAGIERSLHRFSALRNRRGKIIGITCRVGRAVFGTIRPIEDLIFTGKSVLLLGRPGVGKTTMLREVARVLAEDAHKRVVVVDTSNEIAGDGDIPHPGIGKARRMQVPTPTHQHAVMIEAVENHMPEVIIIDEMGTELEAEAARTIAERGVQLIATAHGNTLENLVLNPTLSDLVGGVQTVILGDEEARRRRTQKTVQERKRPPTFDIVVEIQGWEKVAVHADVASVVDTLLRGIRPNPEVRQIDAEGRVHKSHAVPPAAPAPMRAIRAMSEPEAFEEPEEALPALQKVVKLYAYGVNRTSIEQASHSAGVTVEMTDNLREADMLVTTKAHYRRAPQAVRTAEELGTPVHVLRRNARNQVEEFLRRLGHGNGANGSIDGALQEAQDAVERVWAGEQSVQLNPQRSYVRRLQHQLASRYNLDSQSAGREPHRSITISRPASDR